MRIYVSHKYLLISTDRNDLVTSLNIVQSDIYCSKYFFNTSVFILKKTLKFNTKHCSLNPNRPTELILQSSVLWHHVPKIRENILPQSSGRQEWTIYLGRLYRLEVAWGQNGTMACCKRSGGLQKGHLKKCSISVSTGLWKSEKEETSCPVYLVKMEALCFSESFVRW
jgi:hypothetical protein